MRNRFDNEPPRRRDMSESRYLRDDNNREFDDPHAYQDFDEAVYGDHKQRRAKNDDERARRVYSEYPRRAYNDDHEAREARRYWQSRDRFASGHNHDSNSSADFARGFRDDGQGYAQNYGPYNRPARSQRDHVSINPYVDADRPYFTGGQLNEDRVPSTQRMDHGFDPDYLRWRENELTRHDTAYSDWRKAQASTYDTAYSTWRQSRQDQFAKDFSDWRNTQASATTGQNATAASIPSSKDKNTTK